MAGQQLLVLLQEGLALGRVDDDGIGLRGGLHVGGEARSAGADDARFTQPIREGGEFLGHESDSIKEWFRPLLESPG